MNWRNLILIVLVVGAVATSTSPDFTTQIKIGPNYNTLGFETTSNYVANPSGDQRLVFQSALDNTGTAGGGTVKVGAGTFVINGNIEMSSRTWFKGSGMYQTTLKLQDFANSFIIGTSRRSGFVRANQQDSIIISDMTIDGNGVNQYNSSEFQYGRYGIFTQACTNVWFRNVRVTGCQDYGIDPHGWQTGNIWGQNLTISDCVSENNGWDGYALDQTVNIHIYNSVAYRNGRHGINVITGSRNVHVHNNTVTNNGYFYYLGSAGCGIMVQQDLGYNTHAVSVSNNHISYNKKAGVCLSGVYDVTVENNSIDKNCYCFYFTSSWNSKVKSNTCTSKILYSTVNTTVSTIAGSPTSTVCVTDNTFNSIKSCSIYNSLP